MNLEFIFKASCILAIPFWLLIILLPRWHLTERIMRSPWVIAAPCALYTCLVLPRMLELLPTLMNPTLIGLVETLGSPEGATIAWIHFLAFDLFAARYIYLESLKINIHPLIMAPILLLTLIFGPAGFLIFLLAHYAFSKKKRIN